MKCETCGATLREGAHFCNKCGAVQSGSGGEAATGVTSGASDSGAAVRARRPARVARTADESDAKAPQRALTAPVATEILDAEALERVKQDFTAEAASAPDSEAVAAELAEPEMPELEPEDGDAEDAVRDTVGTRSEESIPAASHADSASAETGEAGHAREGETSSAEMSGESPQTPEAAPGASATAEAGNAAAPTWEDADTMEYNVILARGESLDAMPTTPAPADMPALNELARTHGDALPWPLPESIIVGGRYRVEEAVTTVPDAPGAENVYRVRDLQGYERCWSCGAKHGAEAASDRFCQQCGADMLARDFLMSERRADGSDDGAAADGEPEVEADGRTERAFTQGARAYRVLAREVEARLFPRGVRVVVAMATDTGVSRAGEENEDSAGMFTLSVAHDSYTEPLTLCVVADGLGGHASGQEASRLAISTLAAHILRTVALPHVSAQAGGGADAATFEPALLPALTAGVAAANKAICARNAEIDADMGSTCVAALIYRDTAYFLNVGDSRGYVLDDDGLRRITTDHSLVEQLIAGGLIAPEERYTHPQRNQIFRSLGDDPNIPLDTFTQKLRPGMRLLLCSDGLWELVRDDEMARILRETASPQQACDVLIALANEHGGEDNISAVLVDICA